MPKYSLFDSERLTLPDAIIETQVSLLVHASKYKHWAIAFSGGKDSTATLTVIAWLIESGKVPPPESLSVFYADTRMELPPLLESATKLLLWCNPLGWQTEQVWPEMDERFFVYMFGRGVPPPSNTFRWCTEGLKIRPIGRALWRLRERVGEKPLLILGLRLGESQARDSRILLSCSRSGECGQGWFQERPPRDAADTLAPLLHWRTCHVWDWLQKEGEAPEHGWPTEAVADAYGGQGDHEVLIEAAARTGCVGCNLASQDFSLQRILRQKHWSYLEPLRRLKPLYAELKLPQNRLRKDGTETRADGSLVKNPMRMGPLTMDARHWGKTQVMTIQREINEEAYRLNRPPYWLILAEEGERIIELIEANTWPNRWTGTEPRADTPLPEVLRDGSVQHGLFEDESLWHDAFGSDQANSVRVMDDTLRGQSGPQ